MNLQHLRYFRDLADIGHFGRTANFLDIKQPSLTYAIKHLELSVGKQLFNRSGRTVELTPSGKLFRIIVDMLLNTFESGVEYLQDTEELEEDIALLLICDERISEDARDAAIQFIEKKDFKDVIPMVVTNQTAQDFVSTGLANYELIMDNDSPFLEEKLPFKFSTLAPPVKLLSDNHFRYRGKLEKHASI